MQLPEVTRRTVLGAGTAALALPTLAACQKSNLPGSDPDAERTLVVGASDEPQTMDLTANAQAAIPQVLLYNVYETMVRIDSEGKLRPLLATAWTISEDRKTYRFTLNEHAKFASGTKLEADAVVKSLELFRKEGVGNKAQAAKMSVIESVKAEDPRTVVITLKRPSMLWLYDLAGTSGVVIDPAGMSTLADRPMGSGPFVFDSHQRGSSVTLKRNSEYWGTPTRIDEVTFRYFTDANAMNGAMLAGDLDIISDLTAPESLDQFTDTSRFTVIEGTTNGEVVLGMNHKNAALGKKQVRQAICHAIDRQALVDSVWGGKGTMIGSMVPPSDPWYEDLSKTYPFDPAKARELLKEAGHATGLKLNFRVPALPYGPGVGKFVASQLKDVGIDVRVEDIDFNTWINEVFVGGKYDLTVVAHVEPRDIVSWTNKDYYWHYDNPEFNRLIAEADSSDEATGIEKMKQAARILAEDAAADFLWLFPRLCITKASVQGIPTNSTSVSFDLTGATVRSS